MTVWCDDCMYSTLEERNGLTGVSMIARPPELPEDQNAAVEVTKECIVCAVATTFSETAGM